MGNLVFKLQGPDKTVITLASRPGHKESKDNGKGVATGYLSDLSAGFPIKIRDGAGTSAEKMGADLFAWQVVCKNGAKICEFSPNPGAASGSSTLSGAFGGKASTGSWALCVGDAEADKLSGDGALQAWTLTLNLGGQLLSRQSPSALNVVIEDNKYDGSLASMACHNLTVN